MSSQSINYPRLVIGFGAFGVGIIGNLIVISVIVILKDYRKSVTHWYMLQLAVADFLFLTMVPYTMSEVIYDRWIFSDLFCKVQKSVLFFNYYISAMILMVMSIDRYLAVCHSLSPRVAKIRKPLPALIVTGTVWVIAAISCYPTMMSHTKMGIYPLCKCGIRWPRPDDYVNHTAKCIMDGFKPEHIKQCVAISEPAHGSNSFCPEDLTLEERQNLQLSEEFLAHLKVVRDALIKKLKKFFAENSHLFTEPPFNASISSPYCNFNHVPEYIPYVYYNFTVMYLLPVLTMVVFYGLIINHVRKSNHAVTARSSPAPDRRVTLNKTGYNPTRRVTIMCASLVVNFTLLWLPYQAFTLAKALVIYGSDKTHLCNTLTWVSGVLLYVNSATNPYLYNFLSSDFAKRRRTALNKVKKALGCSGSAAPSAGTSRQSSREGTGGLTGTMLTRFYRTKSEDNVSIKLHHSTRIQPSSDVAMCSTPLRKQKASDSAPGENSLEQGNE